MFLYVHTIIRLVSFWFNGVFDCFSHALLESDTFGLIARVTVVTTTLHIPPNTERQAGEERILILPPLVWRGSESNSIRRQTKISRPSTTTTRFSKKAMLTLMATRNWKVHISLWYTFVWWHEIYIAKRITHKHYPCKPIRIMNLNHYFHRSSE